MSRYWCLCALVLVMLAIGCSSQPGAVSKRVQATPPLDKAKAALQDVVKTGEVGSGLDDVQTYAEELKKTDSAKADSLSKQLATLRGKGGKPEEAKTAAKEILDKL
jgi:hypothetical protein